MLTDQGANFVSNLLKQVYQLLGIKNVHGTPYHPKTDGLTERFNQTIKQMLCKFGDETGPDRDQLLLFLLFVYRMVPKPSTCFSLFKLFYGYEVRSLLALLRETWEKKFKGEEPINAVTLMLI